MLITIMKRLDGSKQRFSGQNKKLNFISADLCDTSQHVHAHNLAVAKLETGVQQESSTHADDKKGHGGLFSLPITIPKATDAHSPRFFKMEFPRGS